MMEKRQYSWITLIVILIIGFITYFFLNVSFKANFLNYLIPFVFVILLFLAYRRDMYSLVLVLLTSITFFLALGISFGKVYTGASPISIDLVLGEFSIFIISLISSLLIWLWHERSRYKNKFPLILLTLFIVIWIILGINVSYFDDWKLENYLTVPFVLLLFLTFRKFKLSNLSYTLIFIYMNLHIIGTHYTYAEVPFGFWLQNFLSLPRNEYDRIVHFSFGLLLAYPIREIAIRIGNLKGVWNLYFPVDFVLAFSAVYEIIEWIIAISFGGDLGVAYLGSQGDIWDAQKDMLMAGLGSIAAMIVTAIFVWIYNSKGFINEVRESMKIKTDEVLGERLIEKYWKKINN